MEVDTVYRALLLVVALMASPGLHFGASYEQQQQLLLAYYSGVGEATVGTGGLNALSLAFFSPSPMFKGTCNFATNTTPCIRPASGAGSQLGLAWIIETIGATRAALSEFCCSVLLSRLDQYMFVFVTASHQLIYRWYGDEPIQAGTPRPCEAKCRPCSLALAVYQRAGRRGIPFLQQTVPPRPLDKMLPD